MEKMFSPSRHRRSWCRRWRGNSWRRSRRRRRGSRRTRRWSKSTGKWRRSTRRWRRSRS